MSDKTIVLVTVCSCGKEVSHSLKSDDEYRTASFMHKTIAAEHLKTCSGRVKHLRSEFGPTLVEVTLE